MEHELMYEKLSPTKLFIKCAVPSMISMAVASLYTVADGIFVGRFIGAQALAGVNLVMPFIIMSFSLADMVAVGSSVQIAISLGKKEKQKASEIFTFSCILIQLISLLAGIAAYFLCVPIVHAMGATGALADVAVEYIRVYALCSPVIMIFFAVDNYLRICGKNKYSMWMNVCVSILNIVLDWFFICKLGLGVWSAAFASCLSLATGTIISFLPFLSKKLTLCFVKIHISMRTIGNIFANGSSGFFSNISSSIYMVLINAVLLQISGEMAVAAFSIIMYVDSILQSLLYGMYDSLQPALSYQYGSGSYKRIIALLKRGLFAGCIISVGVMLLMILKGDTIISLFIHENNFELIEMSRRAMFLFALSYLVRWFGTASESFFTALNRPVFSLIVSFSFTIVFPVLFLLILPVMLGLDGVWLTAAFSGVLTTVLSAILLISALKKIKVEI